MDIANNLKALLVISILAGITFRVAKPLCVRYTSAENFDRRRNVWFLLTVAAFVSPSIWLYFIVAAPFVIWAGRKDTNSLSLFILLMYVIPPYEEELPSIVIESIFEFSNIRLLGLTILLPAAVSIFFAKKKSFNPKFRLFDFLILSFILLQLVLYIPYEAITNTMRRAFLSFLDVWLIYYVTSRTSANRSTMLDVMSTFCLACAIFAPIAIFESLKTWLPYTELANTWDVFSPRSYLFRSGILRAQASTGHSLNLGGLMAIGFAFWLGLKADVASGPKKIAGTIWLWCGLLAAYSRAPWLSALLIYIVTKGLGPHRVKSLLQVALISGIGLGALLISPIGGRVVDSLPFVGTVDEDNVAYRQQLAEKSWELVQQNPIFGDPFFMTKMEDLRQGEGIIDLVNAFAAVALSTGLVGLALFVLPIIIGLAFAYKSLRQSSSLDTEYRAISIAVLSAVIGSMVLIGSGGIGGGYGHYLLISLLIGLTQMGITSSTKITKAYR